MTIPSALKEPLKQLPPITRILLICLILAIMALSSVIIYMNNSSNNMYKEEITNCQTELDSSRKEVKNLILSENERLKSRDKWIDSNLKK